MNSLAWHILRGKTEDTEFLSTEQAGDEGRY